MTQQLETSLSPLIESQFPSYYQEHGPILIEFIKQYFVWLETKGEVNYYSRQHLTNRDIDTTFDEFLLHFKNKFIKNIQLDTVSSTRAMVKASLPFYRSKGSDLSFDLFFKLVFGTPASIYHPGDDVFSLSSGDWHKDTYLEVSPMETNRQFVGQEIIGVTSGAVAFVDRIVRRTIKKRFCEIFYISAIEGYFITGELIYSKTGKVGLLPYNVPGNSLGYAFTLAGF